MTLRLGRRLATALLALGALASDPVQAGDVTAFATLASPTDTWQRGFGAALSSTWFKLIQLEAEAARIPVEEANGTMTTFTGSAMFAPPIGRIVPYAGLGIGVYRQALASDGDNGILRTFVIGGKLKLGLFVVRADYRTIRLGGDALLPLEHRVTLGAGISF